MCFAENSTDRTILSVTKINSGENKLNLKPNRDQQKCSFRWWEILARWLMFKRVESRSSRFWNRTNVPSCIMFKMSNSGLCSSLWAWVRTGKRKIPEFPFFFLESSLFVFPSILDFVIKKNPLLNHHVWKWRILSYKIPNFLLYQKSESKLGARRLSWSFPAWSWWFWVSVPPQLMLQDV